MKTAIQYRQMAAKCKEMTDNGPELYEEMSIKVYADANNEDFTDDFTIPIYEELEED